MDQPEGWVELVQKLVDKDTAILLPGIQTQKK